MSRAMKNLILAISTTFIMTGLVACGSSSNSEPASNEATPRQEEKTDTVDKADDSALEKIENTKETSDMVIEDSKETSKGSKSLVVYFSTTGTTKGVAEKIAAVTGSDIYEIKAAQEYTDADLNWHDSNSRTTKEQDDPAVRPEISSETISLEGYDTIYIGYPIWWGEEPRIMDTFVESYDFDKITMIPFCTSGGSGVGRSDKNLAENAGSGNWLDGERLSGSASESDIESWINNLQQ